MKSFEFLMFLRKLNGSNQYLIDLVTSVVTSVTSKQVKKTCLIVQLHAT